MEKTNCNTCNFQESPVIDASELRPYHIRMAKKILNMMFTFTSRLKYKAMRTPTKTVEEPLEIISQNLKPGDWVEVKSLREITSMLDEKGKFKGLYFMPEMEAFCGKKFKVFKKAEKIKLESNGELRQLKNPSFFLEGVYCNGFFQGGCDRACFHYWREEWLKKVPE
jgi:hypothetical protein